MGNGVLCDFLFFKFNLIFQFSHNYYFHVFEGNLIMSLPVVIKSA